MSSSDYPVLFFDGVCNLCNRVVQFIIRQDSKELFRFASLQSAAGQQAQADLKRKGIDTESVILLYKGQYYTQSDAVLHVLRLLGGIWTIGLAGYIMPRFFRNWIYRKVTLNRYRWFGKRDSCMIPTTDLSHRFLQ